jgi:hypothetical protein
MAKKETKAPQVEAVEPEVEDGSDLSDEAIMDRFRAAERHLRRLRVQSRVLSVGIVFAIGVAATAWISSSVGSPGATQPGTVEAHRIVLLGADGLPRGEWSVDEEGNADLHMLDVQQRERLSLSVRSEGQPGLALSNSAGERRVALGLLPDETTSLVFADGSGVPRAVLGLVRGDAASLLLADAEGVSRIGFGLDGRGMGSVVLPDAVADAGYSPSP